MIRSMIEPIDSIDDERLAPYRNLKEMGTDIDERFIAEGEFLVRRLIESDLFVESILITPRRLESFEPIVSDDTKIYVAREQSISDIVGFHFHRGVIACGARKPFVALADAFASARTNSTYVICPQVSDTENLGGIMRSAAAFGASALVIGPECCDPFLRRCVRVSMGAVFNLPIVRSDNLDRDFKTLSEAYSVEIIAAVLENGARLLSDAKRSNRPVAIVLGHEASGLTPDIIQRCHQSVTIPMHHGTDSLNVATAAAIFLYHFTRE